MVDQMKIKPRLGPSAPRSNVAPITSSAVALLSDRREMEIRGEHKLVQTEKDIGNPCGCARGTKRIHQSEVLKVSNKCASSVRKHQ